MRSGKLAAVLLLVTLLGPASLLFGQTATGEVNGTVTDKTGGLVAGASVKLINQATRIEDRTATNSSGYFIFINVKPGTYVLRVELQGFKTEQVAPFDVGVNQTVTQDAKLDVGEVTETVEVRAEAQMLQQSSSELGTVITQRAVSDLPLNGRNFTQLLTLTPGVTPVSTSQNRSIGGVEGNVGIPGSGFADPSFHGQENRSKLYFFDGIINTNIRGPTYIVIPNIDLIQEFKVVGHDSKSEFGGATGGVVNMVSKSGTNSLHGSAFEFVRNNAFDARNTFTDHDPVTQASTPPLGFRQNQFGVEVGGPILRDKTFISGGYDGWRYSKPTQSLFYVPTAAELNGDFSNTGLFTTPRQLYNPYSTRRVGSSFVRDPFRCDAAGAPLPVNAQNQQSQATGTPCNKIPPSLIFAPMQQFFKAYSAVPNYFVATDPAHNFVQNRAEVSTSNSFQVRVDHRFRGSDNVFFRYTEQRVSFFSPLGTVGSTQGTGVGRNYGGGWVHAFSPSLILDVRAGYAGRPSVDSSQQNQDPHGLEPMKAAGFQNVDQYQGMLVAMASGQWSNGASGNAGNFGIRGPAPRENPNWSVTPNITWTKGTHNLKTGFWFIDAKRAQLNTLQRVHFADNQTQNPASTSNTGMSLASALLGLPNQYEAQLPGPHGGPVDFKYAAWAAYVQDEWKIKPRLTLTAGLRFDALTQPETTDGRLWNALDLPNKSYVIGAVNMPPLCSVAGIAPCIPDGAPLYAPGTSSSCNNTTIPCDFRQDAHFNNVIVAGKRFFAFPPVRDNWGPRVGLAWAITPKTVVRVGYGLYWDAVPARSQYAQNDLEAALWPDALAVSTLTLNAPVDFIGTTPTRRFVTDAQASVRTSLPSATPWTSFPNLPIDPHFKDGYSQQWHVEVQRQITPNLMISAAYVGSKNGRLDYQGKANTAPQAFPAGTPAATIDAERPMPWVDASIGYEQSIGYSRYNALEVRLQRRFANGLTSLLSYTWGKSLDVSSGYFGVENGPGGGSAVQNYYDQRSNYGVSGFDITHFLSWATVYELPAGRGKRWFRSGPASWIFGNWQANYIFQARTGQPFTMRTTGDIANISGSGGVRTQNASGYGRPNIIADPFKAGPVPANPDARCQKTISQGGRAADATRTPTTWFNPCAFTTPSGSFGNLGRTPYRGPAVVNMDFSMFKSIPLPREGMALQLRFEAFNVFNIQNWDTPTTANSDSGLTVNSAAFGLINTLAQGTTPRELQFGLRFVF
jgi:Carboxypeptidase regulatory-like domain/TonB dependent receptor